MSDVTEEVDETETVFYWRRDRLLASGFPLEDAEMLAVSKADIHRAEALLSQGATSAQVVRILT